MDPGCESTTESDGQSNQLAPSMLEDLAAPNTIAIIGSGDEGVVVVAVHDGAGFDSKDPVDLQLMFVDDYLVSASYTTADASVSPRFAPLDGATIEHPTENS